MRDIDAGSRVAAGTLGYLCLDSSRQAEASHVHVHEIVRGLRKLGWTVELFESAGGTASRFAFAERLRRYVTLQFRACRHLDRFDALYVRAHPADVPALLVARLFHVPTVIEVNGCYDDVVLAYPAIKPVWPLIRIFCRASLTLGTVVIAVTEGLRKWVREQTGEKPVFVVPNGADTELFRPEAPNETPIDGDYVVFVGTLARWQGIETLLRGIDVPEWPPGLKLVVVGDGPERELVAEAAHRTPRVIYLGRKPQCEIPGIVAAAVAGLSVQNNRLHRSDKGLCPLKVFETMACGVPVIVTDFPGQADLIRENQCGLVVPDEDPAALTRAIASLYANSELRHSMGKRGREVAVEHCSWEQRARAIDRILVASHAA